MPNAKETKLNIYIAGVELALLRKLDFPCSEQVLASALHTDEGIQLSGTYQQFDSLCGWVAGEANEAERNRARRKADMLLHIFEELDSALISASYRASRR